MQQSRTTETQGNHDLFDAFSHQGCPVCTLVGSSVTHYMTSTNYDSVSDPEIRRHFEASQGFCNLHAHQWLQEAFVLGTAQIYRDVLLVVSADLRRQSFRGSSLAKRVGSVFGRQKGDAPGEDGLVRPTESCPACVVQEETENRLLKTLLKGLQSDPFRTAFAESNGLCVPHLRIALANATHRDTFDALQGRAIQAQDTLIAHLNESIRKHDYRFQHEPSGEEKGSPARAVTYVAGADGVIDSPSR